MGGKGFREITGVGEKKMIKQGLRRSKIQIVQIILLFAFCSLLSTFFAGCGYTTRSMISNKFKTIYVVPFVNKIDITKEEYTGNKYKLYKPMLETDITKSVTNKFLFDGNLRPTREDNADLILKGELIEFRRDPLRYTDNNEVEEYRINLVVNISLWNKKENKLVWEENGFTGDSTYFTSFTKSGTPKSDDTAVNDAIIDLARRIVERAVEQW